MLYKAGEGMNVVLLERDAKIYDVGLELLGL